MIRIVDMRARIRQANDDTYEAGNAHDADGLVTRDTHSIDLGARLGRLGLT
jgi:hypothetical protein